MTAEVIKKNALREKLDAALALARELKSSRREEFLSGLAAFRHWSPKQCSCIHKTHAALLHEKEAARRAADTALQNRHLAKGIAETRGITVDEALAEMGVQ